MRMQQKEILGFANAFDCFPIRSLRSLKVYLETPIRFLNFLK